MQEALKDLEKQLDKLLGKGSPYQMSDKARHALAGASWAIALFIGIFQAWAALSLWDLGDHAVAVLNYANDLAGGGVTVPSLGFFFYFSLLVILADAVLLLMAVPHLKDLKKRGWELLYYSLLINIIYSFLRIFSNIGGGFGQFIVQLFFSAIAGYFLFQIRDVFTPGKVKVEMVPGKHPGKVLEERKQEKQKPE